MPDGSDHSDLPQATAVAKKRTRISIVWIIPLLAAVVAVGIAVQRLLSEGPTISIVFKNAQGIEAGKTFVKYKDVNIGQVTSVQLAEEYTKVTVTAKIAKSAAGLMVEDAAFWVVEPRVTLSGVSGLGTLLSGNYIGFEAGKSDSKQSSFTGQDVPPIITGDQPGRQFVLKACLLYTSSARTGGFVDDLVAALVSAAQRGVTCCALMDSLNSARSGLTGRTSMTFTPA